jgi:hypothetical protein
MSRKLFIAAAALCAATSAHAAAPVIVANWSMDSTLVATGANAASAVAALVGGTTGSFVAGATTNASDKAYNTTHYPATGNANMSAGLGFAVSTVGFQNLVISWDDKRSNTAANSEVLQYSLDGTHFTSFGGVMRTTNANTFNHHSVDLSTILGANGDASFAFRVVSAFDTPTAYVGTVSTYGTGGTIRFDNVTVMGVSAVPEPESYAMLLAGLGLAGAMVRRRK